MAEWQIYDLWIFDDKFYVFFGTADNWFLEPIYDDRFFLKKIIVTKKNVCCMDIHYA